MEKKDLIELLNKIIRKESEYNDEIENIKSLLYSLKDDDYITYLQSFDDLKSFVNIVDTRLSSNNSDNLDIEKVLYSLQNEIKNFLNLRNNFTKNTKKIIQKNTKRRFVIISTITILACVVFFIWQVFESNGTIKNTWASGMIGFVGLGAQMFFGILECIKDNNDKGNTKMINKNFNDEINSNKNDNNDNNDDRGVRSIKNQTNIGTLNDNRNNKGTIVQGNGNNVRQGGRGGFWAIVVVAVVAIGAVVGAMIYMTK